MVGTRRRRIYPYTPSPTPQREKATIHKISNASIDLEPMFLFKLMDTDQWLAIGAICSVFVGCVCIIGSAFHTMRRIEIDPTLLLEESLPTHK